MKKTSIYVILFIVLFAVQGYTENQGKTLSPKSQLEIITELQSLISDNYILKDKVKVLNDGLSDAVSNGLFSQPMLEKDFINLANKIIQQSFPDRHLGIITHEKYEEVKLMFGNSSTEPEGHNENPEHHAPPSSHTQPHATAHTQGHQDQPSNHASRKEREKQGQDAIHTLAGITRVAEINRDGLNQIGYIAFDQLIYSDKSVSILQNIFSAFTESERIIIDMRECQGGDADMVKFISNFFFDKPTHLVSSLTNDGTVQERWTEPNSLSPYFANKKLDVLISHKTFSAGESFAFGLKQLGRARLLGEATGGGGHMNDFFPLPSGLGASISVGRTFDPRSGEGWQANGVTPNIQFEKDHTLSETICLITKESGKLDALNEEEKQIYNVMQNYTYAWYNADTSVMKNLLDNNFNASYSTSRSTVTRNYKEQVKATKEGFGVLERLYHNRIIDNINISNDIASVNLILRETTHKIKLLRDKNSWKIVEDSYQDKRSHG